MLPRRTRVVRVMPNTPCLIREGCSVFSCGTSTKAGDSQTVKKLLSSVGLCEEVPEALIDPATGLSGSGPAYVSKYFILLFFLLSSFFCFRLYLY